MKLTRLGFCGLRQSPGSSDTSSDHRGVRREASDSLSVRIPPTPAPTSSGGVTPTLTSLDQHNLSQFSADSEAITESSHRP